MAKRQEVLEKIQRAQDAFTAALEGLPADAMLRPGVVGLWSVKDVIAHVTIWQSELITALSQLDRPGRVPGIVLIEDLDEFNEEQYHANVRRSLESVLEDLHGVHKHLLKVVEALDDKTLDNARKFPWMEGEPLSYLIEENGYLHEQEHADAIRKWREEQGI